MLNFTRLIEATKKHKLILATATIGGVIIFLADVGQSFEYIIGRAVPQISSVAQSSSNAPLKRGNLLAYNSQSDLAKNLLKSSSTTRTFIVAPVKDLRSGEQISSLPEAFRLIGKKGSFNEHIRESTEDILINLGSRVVERNSVDELILEIDFQSVLSSEKTAKLGNFTGADTIVFVSITDLNYESSKFNGYNMRFNGIVVTSKIRVKVVDLGSGEVLFI